MHKICGWDKHVHVYVHMSDHTHMYSTHAVLLCAYVSYVCLVVASSFPCMHGSLTINT